jgi:hypothetical protein
MKTSKIHINIQYRFSSHWNTQVSLFFLHVIEYSWFVPGESYKMERINHVILSTPWLWCRIVTKYVYVCELIDTIAMRKICLQMQLYFIFSLHRSPFSSLLKTDVKYCGLGCSISAS